MSAISSRIPSLVRGVDRRLYALAAVAVISAVAWCIALPAMQGPDELRHFAYVQRLAETGTIVWGAGNGRAYSPETELAIECTGVRQMFQNPAARAPESSAQERDCYHRLHTLGAGARDGGGYTSADRNPPAYYLYAAVPYLIFKGSSWPTRAFVLRLANLLPLTAIIVFVWLIAGELLLALPRGDTLRTLATAAVALNPQLMQMTATINPDVLLAAVWAAGLWLSLIVVRRGLSGKRVAGLVASCALAALTQGRGLSLIAPATLALGMAAWRVRPPRTKATRTAVLAASVIATVIALYALVRYSLSGDVTATRIGDFLNYLWQFY